MLKNWLFALPLAGLLMVGLDIKIGPSAVEAQEQAWVELSNSPVSDGKVAIDTDRLNQAYTTLAENVSPTVVNIYTTTTTAPRRQGPGPFNDEELFEYFFGNPLGPRSGPRPPRQAQALGSGFVINAEEGYIVTNSHVVRQLGKNADQVMVKFLDETTGKGHRAEILGVDELSDVALLKLSDRTGIKLKAAPLGDSDAARVGEWVMAIGNPYGHSHTVTQGILSARGRNLPGMRAEFLQTSASINPGNSGGPLFNLRGEVVGINTAIDPRAQGIGFAIPINTAKHVISQLAEHGKVKRPWIGIAIADIDEEIQGLMRLPDQQGVLVREVMKGQPASAAGLKPYDIIREVNGREIKNSQELLSTLDRMSVGKEAQIQVLRDRKVKDLTVKIGEQPAVNS